MSKVLVFTNFLFFSKEMSFSRAVFFFDVFFPKFLKINVAFFSRFFFFQSFFFEELFFPREFFRGLFQRVSEGFFCKEFYFQVFFQRRFFNTFCSENVFFVIFLQIRRFKKRGY